MVLLLILGPVCLPEYRAPKSAPIDWASALLCTLAVLAIVYGIKRLAEGDAPAPALAAIALGLAVGLAFLRRQAILAAPLLDLKLFRAPGLSTALLINVVSFFVGFGSFLMTAQYLQLVLGLSPLAAGLWSLPAGLGFVAGSFLTTPLSSRMRPAYALALGLGVSAIGFAAMAAAGGGRDLAPLAVGNLIVSLGMAPCAAIAADLVVGAAPPEKAGVASGLNETSSEFGGALGIALMGSAMTFLYRGQLQRALPPGLSPSLAEAALRTLGGATAAGRLLPDHGQALAAAARQAYAEAFRTTAFGGAIILALSAAAAVAALRRKATATG
jgi:DHA2 family multidrug resistance protein-like MFS transporter